MKSGESGGGFWLRSWFRWVIFGLEWRNRGFVGIGLGLEGV